MEIQPDLTRAKQSTKFWTTFQWRLDGPCQFKYIESSSAKQETAEEDWLCPATQGLQEASVMGKAQNRHMCRRCDVACSMLLMNVNMDATHVNLYQF